MSVRGLCHICSRPADRLCSNCHQPTCFDHLGRFGLCASCQTMGKRID